MAGTVRILHLVPVDPDFQTDRGAAVLRANLGAGFETESRTIGRGGTYRHLPAAVVGLRGERAADLVHAWGERAFAAAALASVGPIVFSPAAATARRSIGWLRAAMNYRDVQVVCPSATARRAMVERGVPIGRCHVIRPGVDFAPLRRRRNADLRAALGFADSDRVLLAAGESTEAANHELAVWAGSMLHILDERYKVLLWGRGPRAARAANLARKLGRPGMVRVANRQLGRPVAFDELPAAADAAIVTATGPVATLPIATCMAAGLPIVSTVTYTVAELLEDRHTAVMVAKPSPRLIARRVLELYEDANLQWSIADVARTEAYEFFSLTRFVSQYRAAYQKVTSHEPVEVLEPAAGAGSRFHGRA